MRIFLFGSTVLTILLASPSASQAMNLPTDWIKVPKIVQSTEYSCGAASLLSVLYYWGVYDGNETQLMAELKTDKEMGTSPEALVKRAKELGLKANWRTQLTLRSLLNALKRGKTVVVNFQAWHPESSNKKIDWENEWEQGHYAVLIGADLASDTLYFMDPSAVRSYAFLKASEFIRRWHDYSLDDRGRIKRHWRGAVVIEGKREWIQSADRLEPIF